MSSVVFVAFTLLFSTVDADMLGASGLDPRSGGISDVLSSLKQKFLFSAPSRSEVRGQQEEQEQQQPVQMIELKKVTARAVDGASAVRGHFYTGTIRVGTPARELEVIFDTSSGNVVVPWNKCKSKACKEHRQYSSGDSQTAQDVNQFGKLASPTGERLLSAFKVRDFASVLFTQVDLGTGKASGPLVRDEICLSSGACASAGIIAADIMEEVPFLAMPNDGLVGLGLGGLSVSPAFNFLDALAARSPNAKREFGIHLGAAGGELFFGGHDSRRLAAPLHWFPVAQPEDGYWQVWIREVRVGNVTVDPCPGGCRAVVDSASSKLGVPMPVAPLLATALASGPEAGAGCRGPDLELELGGFPLVLRASDYGDEACAPDLVPLPLPNPPFGGVYTIGESVLRRYYAAFDWENMRVGFSPLAGRFVRLGKPGSGAVGRPAAEPEAQLVYL